MKTNVLRTKYEIFNRASTSILRGVCMILIMLHHCYQQGIHYDISFNRVVSCVLKDAGFLCTGVFFMLSGYGLYLSMEQRSFVLSRNYIINRFIKLFVPYGWYFFVAWGLALGGALSYPASLYDVFNFLLLSTPQGEPIWFFIVIVFLYLFIFFSFSIKSVKQPVYILTLIILIYAVIVKASMIGLHWYNSVICFPVGTIIASKINALKQYANIRYLVLFGLFFLTLYPKGQCMLAILFSISTVIVMRLIPFQESVFYAWLKYIGNNSLLFFFSHCLGINICPFSPNQFGFVVYCMIIFVLSLAFTFLFSVLQKPVIKKLSLN